MARVPAVVVPPLGPSAALGARAPVGGKTAGAANSFVATVTRMARTFLYRCPNTGQNVQGWSADELTDDDDTYQSFECTACTRVHLVNLKTGKVLGEEED